MTDLQFVSDKTKEWGFQFFLLLALCPCGTEEYAEELVTCFLRRIVLAIAV